MQIKQSLEDDEHKIFRASFDTDKEKVIHNFYVMKWKKLNIHLPNYSQKCRQYLFI